MHAPASWIAEARESYDRVAERYADLVRSGLDDLPLETALVDHFARQVDAGGTVLDLGCGPGHLAPLLEAHGARVVGIDLSTEMLRLARARDAGAALAAASLTRLPLADGAVAGVFCFYVLHHVPEEDLAPVLLELARVLAPGGRVLIGGHVGEGSYLKTEGYGGLAMRVVFARRSPETYARLLREAGLVVDATVAIGPEDPARGAIWLAHRV